MIAPADATMPRRPGWRFMLGHPARLLALGFGSGLAPKAPGTCGTLFAWAAFAALEAVAGPLPWAAILVAAIGVGVWACTRCARDLGVADPGAIVWDEVVAFWLVLAAIAPSAAVEQLAAFGLFRFFDATKPGPVGWADRRLHAAPGTAVGWMQGVGILLDDLVAAACTLGLVFAARWLWT